MPMPTTTVDRPQSKIPCPQCGTNVVSLLIRCGHCGTKMPAHEGHSTEWKLQERKSRGALGPRR